MSSLVFAMSYGKLCENEVFQNFADVKNNKVNQKHLTVSGFCNRPTEFPW
jgi:hypothetical protein